MVQAFCGNLNHQHLYVHTYLTYGSLNIFFTAFVYALNALYFLDFTYLPSESGGNYTYLIILFLSL